MKYDLIVIGAGSGGVRAARIASVHGAKVAIVENNRFGGTCVNVGCVPKKLYYYLSQLNKDIENYKSYGWSIPKPSLNWKLFMKKKDQEISRLNKIYEGILNRNKIDIINGTAQFLSSQKIKVGKKSYQAKKFIISTGGKPRIPNISENSNLLNTSDDIFSLKKLPKRMVIEGGGYIAIEFAFIFANLGVKVDLVYRGKQILKSFDNEIVDFLIQSTPKGKIKYHLESKIQKINKSKNVLIVNLSNRKKISTDYILSAIGRIANTENLGLENTNIQLNENKSIKVNRHFQTCLLYTSPSPRD